ncbi:MAG: DNA repair protein RadA [bacterium]|nr:DNA repair protein RadA [bacterium]
MAKKKNRSSFVCSECHAEHAHWGGKCDSCGAWNTLKEMEAAPVAAGSVKKSSGGLRGRLEPLEALSAIGSEEEARFPSGIPDLDLVLGGGLVPGSFILVGGEPGVGKSTLLLEIARHFPKPMYYFTGEESVQQVALRARRMGIDQKDENGRKNNSGDRLFISRETDLESICTRISRERPALAAIDSIQTVYGATRDSLPGSVAQLKEAAMMLLETAKSSRVPLIVTGHITKDGAIAGPRLLEHMVDTVLYFESDRLNHYRMLRAIKNRFGPVGEAAFFEMGRGGLAPLDGLRPTVIHESAPGRVYSVILEGSRPIGVEVQSLVSRSAYGQCRRMAEGLDTRRLVLLAAVLEKYLKARLAECDIFANLAGGLTADEPALDLALCAAILSSYQEADLQGLGCVGEVGLSGEVRPVARLSERVAELTRLGCRRILVPAQPQKGSEATEIRKQAQAGGVELLEIADVASLARHLGQAGGEAAQARPK